MKSSRTGVEQNAINAEELNTRVITYENYLPPRQELTVENLTQVVTNANATLAAVSNADNVLDNATTDRKLAFLDLDDYITSSINAVRICGAPKQTVKQAETWVRELRGKRASEKLSDEEIAALKAEGKEINQNTLHNLSYTSIAETFGKYVSFLGTITQYNPNETKIKIATLNNKASALKLANQTVSIAQAAMDAARLARDTVQYTKVTGLVDVCLDIKLYVKSAYGVNSPQYKSISHLTFTRH